MLALFALAFLASCKNVPESVRLTEEFFANVDSAKYDKVYAALVDDEKALISVAEFVTLFASDSGRAPGFDSTDEWRDLGTTGQETKLRAIRRIPDWNYIDKAAKKGKSTKDYLTNLGANIPRVKDTNRVTTLVMTPNGPRFRIGLKDIIAFEKAKQDIRNSLASNVKVTLKSGVAENNFQAFFHVTGTVANNGDIELKPVVFQVYMRGKLAGTTTLKTPVPAKGEHKGEMTCDYAEGLTPQKLGTSFEVGRGAVNLGGFSVKVISASPADRKELERNALKAIGATVAPRLY